MKKRTIFRIQHLLMFEIHLIYISSSFSAIRYFNRTRKYLREPKKAKEFIYGKTHVQSLIAFALNLIF